MRFRRLVILPVLAAFCAAPRAFAATFSPQTLQCDGTYQSGGNTKNPNPTIQVLFQEVTGLRIGQATMGVTGTGLTNALWRFDSGVSVSDGGCGANVRSYLYTYNDPNSSNAMLVGNCVYNAVGCGASTTLNSSPMIPLGQASCPGSAPAYGGISIFPAGPFGGGDDVATFNGTTQFGSVTYANNSLGNLPPTYTLSAWIKTGSGAQQRILSEQGSEFWGFGVNGTGLRLFDSRNIDGVVGDLRDVTIADGSIVNGAWHKVDVVRNNGLQERFYDNGNFIGSVLAASTDSFSGHPDRHPLMIGKYEGNSEFFSGQIGEIRVLETALTDEEIYLEYNGSNLHQYTGGGINSAYAHVGGGFPGSVTNGFTSATTYTPGEAITPATAPNQRWRFESQNTETVSSILSTFTVTIDASLPTAPLSFGGTPTGINAISWTWTAPISFCPPPGSGSVFYDLYDGVTNAALTPPGNMAYPATSITEGLAGAPNQLRVRKVSLTDHWGTSPLTASASAYTLAAAPTAPAATSVSTGGFVATWGSSPANPGYTRYEVTYSADPAFVVGVSTRVGFGDNFTGNSIDIPAASGATVHVRVRAFNGKSTDFFGGVATSYSPTLDVVTVPPGPTLSGTPTAVPFGITWTWSAVGGATGYTLYDSPTLTVIGAANMAVVTFSTSPLAVNARYDAEVEADMPSPTPPSGRGHGSAYTFANKPTLPIVAAVYATSVTFSWNANGNPANTFYQVIVSTDPGFSVVTATMTVSAPSATATSLFPGVTYYSHVEAINGGQVETGYAATVQAATAPDPQITVSSSPASPYVPSPGLAGAWQFDENTGTTTADSTGQGNYGNFGCTIAACVSTPTFAAGPVGFGSAASFSGLQGGRVLTGHGLSIPGSLTVEAWVNPLTVSQFTGAGIVAVGTMTVEDFALDVSGAHAFEFTTSNGGVEVKTTAPTPLVAGQWTHVVGVYDVAHATATLYVNGVQVATHLGMPARANLAQPIAIGNRQDTFGAFTLPFAGGIDSVRVFNVALTAAQVLADYQGSFVSSVTPPSPNNGIVVALPPNAFGAPAQIFISADPVNHPIRISPAALNAGLAVTPSGLTLVPNSLIEVVPVVNGLPFTTPLGSSATLTIPYSDPSGTGLISGTNPPLTASGIRMYTLNTGVNRWELLPTNVDKVNHAANGVTPHFSVFALFAPSTVAASLGTVKAFPVPWKPGSGGRFDGPGVTFANLPASGTIRILTLAGRRVRDFDFNGVSAGSAVWDGANDDGRRAASGVYFARIVSGVDGTTVLVKFAIER